MAACCSAIDANTRKRDRRRPGRRTPDSRARHDRRVPARPAGQSRRGRASRAVRCVRVRARPRPRRAGPARRVCVAGRPDLGRAPPRRPRRPRSAKPSRRCAGSLSRSNSSRRTSTPVRRCSSRCSASSSGSSPGVSCGQHRAGGVGHRYEVAAQRLGQRADQRDDQLLAQGRHLPAEVGTAEAGQHVERDVDGHPVVRAARVEAVGQGQLESVQLPRLLILPLDLFEGLRSHDVGSRQGEQVRMLATGLLPPRVEVPRRHDLGRDARVVEREQLVIADQQVAPPSAFLQRVDLGEQVAVVREEALLGVPVALDERVADEQLARRDRIDLRVPDAAADDQGQVRTG